MDSKFWHVKILQAHARLGPCDVYVCSHFQWYHSFLGSTLVLVLLYIRSSGAQCPNQARASSYVDVVVSRYVGVQHHTGIGFYEILLHGSWPHFIEKLLGVRFLRYPWLQLLENRSSFCVNECLTSSGVRCPVNLGCNIRYLGSHGDICDIHKMNILILLSLLPALPLPSEL